MSSAVNQTNRRILIIDDNRAIHEDFGKILGNDGAGNSALTALEDELFGEATPVAGNEHFELRSA